MDRDTLLAARYGRDAMDDAMDDAMAGPMNKVAAGEDRSAVDSEGGPEFSGITLEEISLLLDRREWQGMDRGQREGYRAGQRDAARKRELEVEFESRAWVETVTLLFAGELDRLAEKVKAASDAASKTNTAARRRTSYTHSAASRARVVNARAGEAQRAAAAAALELEALREAVAKLGHEIAERGMRP